MTEGAPPHPASKRIPRTVREPHQRIILAVYANGDKERLCGRLERITERACDAEDWPNKGRVLAVANTLPFPRVQSIRLAPTEVALLERLTLYVRPRPLSFDNVPALGWSALPDGSLDA